MDEDNDGRFLLPCFRKAQEIRLRAAGIAAAPARAARGGLVTGPSAPRLALKSARSLSNQWHWRGMR